MQLRRKTGAAAAALGGIGIDEVEALAHEGLLEVQNHPGEVEEAFRIDEDAHRSSAGGVTRSLNTRAKDEDAVAFTGLGVEADGIAQSRAAAAQHAETQP